MDSTVQKAGSEKKVGVYICHCGGNISDHVDVHQLAENIKNIPGVVVTHTNMFMCSDPGQELIQKDIQDGRINRVVVASCAPSLHELTFRGAIKRAHLNPYLYEHANIREQVSWVHHGESATSKATRLVSAAVAKARNLQALEPIRVEARQHATVIGAGVAGMRAALDLSGCGIAVALVEKSPFLGGQAAQLTELVPTGEKAADVITYLAAAVVQDPRITVFTGAEIVQMDGYVGNFKTTLRQRPATSMDAVAGTGPGNYQSFAGFFPDMLPGDGCDVQFETGAIVLATGFKTYTPHGGEYGYGESPEVITLPHLIREMASVEYGRQVLQVNGRAIRRVAFIHCVGSRQIPGIHEPDENGDVNEYCSRTCCSATLQAALQIRRSFPGTHVLEYYRDIRTYGRGQEEIYDQASANNVLFFRYEADSPPLVEKKTGSDHPLKITVKDALTFGENVTAEVDLVVLSVGMVPNLITDVVDMMKLPVGADRFLQEVHPKLRPVEVANTGILLAGTCQAPMDIGEACAAAQAAAAKATALLVKGYVALDPFVANVNLDRCSGTGRCTEVCPVEGAVRMVDRKADGHPVKRAEVNPALCTGCGICVGECAQNAIDVNGWALKQYEEMVDAILAA
ncbi:MAG: CoB--CoM heterodisulfide reductase iron-sulfur subunit A family protein [Desulfobacterales bacterium]